MELEVQELHYENCKGRIRSFVARATEPHERIVRSIQTYISTGRFNRDDLERMLNEVWAESVIPFLGPTWNQPVRQERFQVIRDSLMEGSTCC